MIDLNDPSVVEILLTHWPGEYISPARYQAAARSWVNRVELNDFERQRINAVWLVGVYRTAVVLTDQRRRELRDLQL